MDMNLFIIHNLLILRGTRDNFFINFFYIKY